MTSTAKSAVKESELEIERLERELSGLRTELDQEVAAIAARWDGAARDGVTTESITPRRTDVALDWLVLAWRPVWLVDDGRRTRAEPAWP